MQTKISLYVRNGGKRFLLAFCLTTLGIALLSVLIARGKSSSIQLSTKEVRRVRLSVEDPRPVAAALLKMETKYGWAITYEDPRYVHEGEIANEVEFRKYRSRPGEPKVAIPKGGSLSVDYDVAADSDLPSNPELVIQKILDANSAAGNAGRFRIERDGELLHVIPTVDRDRTGAFTPHESVLDAVINLPEEERSGPKKLQAISDAITKATSVRVVVGTFPTNVLFQYHDRRAAVGEKARDVLVHLLNSAKHGQDLSWRLLYDPEVNQYWLNIHLVQGSKH
jgi:hypothetical protein